MQKLLTAQEMADILNLSVETVWRYTRQKKIPAVELGEKQYRYEKEAVLAALTGDAVLTKEGQSAYRQGNYTYADYVKLPEQPGYRYEVLEGFLVMEPSPFKPHQRVCAALFRQLADFFDGFDPEGEVFFAPLDMTLTERNVLQPDILYISSNNSGVQYPERVDGPCDLAVEIISPSSRRKDRVQKMEIYRKHAVAHYWIADPEAQTLEAFVLRGEHYVLIAVGSPEDAFIHPDFPGLELDLCRIFRKPQREQP